MFVQALWAAAMAVAFVGATAAQCGHEKAVTVRKSITIEGSRDCGGIRFSAQGVTIATTAAKGCPLFATLTPEHEVAKYTEAATETRITAKRTAWAFFFNCEQDWLLIIPWGSNCNFTRAVALDSVPRLKTVPCATTTPAG